MEVVYDPYTAASTWAGGGGGRSQLTDPLESGYEQ